ncbi:aminodeoxychorismate synthase, component I [Halocatena pleomorpha]|uniref:anthranilate synthase n=1 Tax=Halocatena pleomorpha TaxID=1785090 RepID=A0A3P3RBP2_9EURY|nr:aminodeoxychorismate synthase, component I [Halocatena pleomorpha]RRJ30891.1 aminodeoxychorismate synthase, component I [Halocatena pleomorpha]
MSTVVTDRAAFCRLARTGVRVPVEVRVAVDDPFLAYRRARDGDCGVYLETTGGQDGWGYFATEPIDRVTVGSGQTGALETLIDRLDRETLVRGECEIPYPCGAFGWLSYDIARELESIPTSTTDDRQLPRLEIGVYDRVAAWTADASDEKTVELRVTACPRVGEDERPEAAYRRGRTRALELTRAIETGDATVESPSVRSETHTARFESDCGRAAFTERVKRVKEHVRAGETFQANVSQRLSAPAIVHPVETYAALRRVNPAPYSGLLEFPSCDLVSASPELLLEREGDQLRTEPIAGTRPRGETSDEDRALAAELRSDEKERAEHAMLVDLERNDLGKVSEYGSVTVSDYRRIDRYSAVMHLVSVVTSRLREDCDLADAIGAVFPGGTITGAPKPATMAIIDDVEATRRGPYTGSIGAFGFDERATLNIIIRTLVRYEQAYHLRVGAGVVHDSNPEREYDETMAKARALIDALDEAIDVTHCFTVQ